jgi:hypothetical protein
MSKAILHLASQNWPMESKDWEASDGTMCTWRAARGMPSRCSLVVWAEHIALLFGLQMAMGSVARRLLWTGTLVAQKWAVQPVSTIAGVEAITAGGPRAGTGTTGNLV